MKSRFNLIIFFLIMPVIIIVTGMILFVFLIQQKSGFAEEILDQQPKSYIAEVINYQVEVESNFYQAINKQRERKLWHDLGIKGGVVPHHTLVNDLIADFFFELSQHSDPATIIILAPNHSDIGLAPAISGRVNWQTPFGSVTQDYSILNELASQGWLAFDQENYLREHSIRVLTPFIKYYFPHAKIVPLAFTSKYGLEESLALAGVLEKYLEDEKTIMISSIDFSHYLHSDLAWEKDKVILKAIQENQYEFISNLNSDYLDSPMSLIILLKAMSRLDSNHLEVLSHTNSGEFLSRPVESSTSYFTMFFSPLPPITETTLLFGGDVMLSRTVNQAMVKKHDFSWPFREIAETIFEADLAIVNLESPFIKSADYHVPTESFIFKTDPRAIQGLNLAGIDMVNLANNHFGNQGQQGMTDTFEILAENKIDYIGAGQNFSAAHQGRIIEINGFKFGFLGYAYPSSLCVATDKLAGIANMDIDQAKQDISKLRKEVDILIVAMHAGEEYITQPNAQQKNFAHMAIDVGADFIVGHHPHWVQPIEEYKGKPIIYSLGNLVFDQMWSKETQQGALAKVYFLDNRLSKIEIIPIHIYSYGQPKVVEEESEIQEILGQMKLESAVLDFSQK